MVEVVMVEAMVVVATAVEGLEVVMMEVATEVAMAVVAMEAAMVEVVKEVVATEVPVGWEVGWEGTLQHFPLHMYGLRLTVVQQGSPYICTSFWEHFCR